MMSTDVCAQHTTKYGSNWSAKCGFRNVLHCVFLPMLNTSLHNFAKAWNLHPIRTEGNWSPKKIWLNSIIQASDEPDSVPPDFGIDFDGPIPEEDVDSGVVPETVSPLDEEEIRGFISVASQTMLLQALMKVFPILFTVNQSLNAGWRI